MEYKKLIAKMTLEEKASLLSGKDFWLSKSIDRLKIPRISLSDGPHGLRKQAENVDHLGLNKGLPATCFPTAVTIANSWNENLGREIGQYLGKEALSLKVGVLLAPGLNIKRNPLCGRNFEYFSEDPYLSGKMAAAYIKGIQSQGIAACPKHFAVNNQETLRMANDSVVDERALFEIYLTGFEIAVKEGKPKSIMSAYNKINGIYANEDKFLLRDVLRDKWGFSGFVVTDWGGSNDHVAGVEAGSHLEMPATRGNSDIEVIKAVKNGKLSELILDERVDEYLSAIFSFKNMDEIREDIEFDREEHHLLARKAAEESIVLLKNEDHILPIQEKTKIALIGDFARTPRYQGAGSSMVNPTKLDCTEDSMIHSAAWTLIGCEQGYIRQDRFDEKLEKDACALAKKADIVFYYMGLDEVSEIEGLDRSHMKLHQNQISLLEQLKKSNGNIVVVLSGGSSIEMPWIHNCKALLYAGLSGQAGAEACLNILSGKICPSGKLSETYAVHYEDVSSSNYFPGMEKTSEYRESIFVGYRYFDTAKIPVRFPFGYGLSYTSFEYSNLDIEEASVRFQLTNTGDYPGSEIVQLYIGMEHSKIFRAKKELKGFQKVFLNPGETKSVKIKLDDKAFRYFNIKTKKFEVEVGTYQIMVGASSEDIRLSNVLERKGTTDNLPYEMDLLHSYKNGNVKNISDVEFQHILNWPIPQSKWDRGGLLEENDTVSQMIYAKGFFVRQVFKIIVKMKNRAERKGKPNLNILFIYNIPFRGIAKMMDGNVNMDMVHSILAIVNGQFFKGAGKLMKAFFRMKKERKTFLNSLKTAERLRGE